MGVRSAFLALIIGAGACADSNAAYNASTSGTVDLVQQYGTQMGVANETLIFTLSSTPTNVCSNAYFVISPTVMTDPQTRRNTVALLMQAKATGAVVSVGYDSTGGFCNQGFIGVYWLQIQ